MAGVHRRPKRQFVSKERTSQKAYFIAHAAIVLGTLSIGLGESRLASEAMKQQLQQATDTFAGLAGEAASSGRPGLHLLCAGIAVSTAVLATVGAAAYRSREQYHAGGSIDIMSISYASPSDVSGAPSSTDHPSGHIYWSQNALGPSYTPQAIA